MNIKVSKDYIAFKTTSIVGKFSLTLTNNNTLLVTNKLKTFVVELDSVTEVNGVNTVTPWEDIQEALATLSMLDLFLNETDKVMMRRKNSSETTAIYGILQGMGNNVLLHRIGALNPTVGSAATPEWQSYELGRVMGSKHISQATKSGSWSNAPGTSHYGGAYNSNTVQGSYVQWTTTGESTSIGIYDLTPTTSAVYIVEINGDKTLANLLPTAQDLFDTGNYSSILTFCNPTDRVLDPKVLPTGVLRTDDSIWGDSRRLLVATGLSSGAKTVKLINTGISNSLYTASTTVRIAGIFYTDSSLTLQDVSFSGNQLEPLPSENFDTIGTDSNFAISVNSYFLGHSNTQYFVSSELKIDGVSLATIPEHSFTYIGDEIELTVNGILKDGPSGTNRATYTQKYTFRADTGIKVEYTDFTFIATSVASAAYIPQFGFNNSWSRMTTESETTTRIMTADDNSEHASAACQYGWAWNPTTNWGAIVAVPSYKTAPVGNIVLSDRADGVNKIYFLHSTGQTFNIGDNFNGFIVWYRFKKFADATATLAK